MVEGVTVTRRNALENPQLCALIEELCESAQKNIAAGIPVDQVLSCFITVMRTSAYFAGVPREGFDALLAAAAEGNADWWQRVSLDLAKPQGES
jgi:hypothetical protein